MEVLTQLSEVLQKGRADEVQRLTQEALDAGLEVGDVLNGLLDGMAVIGGKFKRNEVFVPEVLIAARAMNSGLEILKPLLAASGVEPVGKVVLGTVKGDLHDIGKNLVRMMLIGAGLEVYDIGVDVSAEKFVEKVKETGAEIVCMSALLTTTMPYMPVVIKALEDAGIRDQVKVMVGGAPVTEEFCTQIGADKYTKDAAECADVAKALVS